MMKTSKLLFLLISSILGFFCISNISKSDNTMVGYSDSKFLYGSTENDTISFEISGGVQTGFSFKVYNKEATSMTYKLGSVDAGTTNDNFNNNTCLSENETGAFGQYIGGEKSSKTIPAGGSGIWNLTAQFPNYYSGVYTGCITFYPGIVGGTTVDTLPRRGNFINVKVHPVGKNFTLKSFAGSRVGGLNNSGTVKIYNTSKVLEKTINISVNENGTGEFLAEIQPGIYYIVFKGQSHLASYLSGVEITGEQQIFDFTTGTNLYGTQEYSLSEDNGYGYQTAGDLKNIENNYDYTINGNDISIMTINGLDKPSDITDPKNLNGDNTAAGIADIGIIGINFEMKDCFYKGPNQENIFNR